MVKLSDIELPYVIKNVPILTEGVWQNLPISGDEIKKAVMNTPWNEKERKDLIFSHVNKAENWLGNLDNPRYDEKVKGMVADLQIWDASFALKLLSGNAKMGLSAEFEYDLDYNRNAKNLIFRNTSFVRNPACKKAWATFSEDEGKKVLTIENIADFNDKMDMDKMREEMKKEHPEMSDEEIEEKIKMKMMDKKKNNINSTERGLLEPEKTMETKTAKFEEFIANFEAYEARLAKIEELVFADKSVAKFEDEPVKMSLDEAAVKLQDTDSAKIDVQPKPDVPTQTVQPTPILEKVVVKDEPKQINVNVNNDAVISKLDEIKKAMEVPKPVTAQFPTGQRTDPNKAVLDRLVDSVNKLGY